MVNRYKVCRRKRPAGEPLPNGLRRDTRKHTRHCLRPSAELVNQFLGQPSSASRKDFATEYWRTLIARYEEDPAPFDRPAKLASKDEIYIGCSCPTKKNPEVDYCHTVLALRLIAGNYPELDVEYP
jgi:hypothetical protein